MTNEQLLAAYCAKHNDPDLVLARRVVAQHRPFLGRTLNGEHFGTGTMDECIAIAVAAGIAEGRKQAQGR
jgi:hypothetical protein